jgi:hypothetical protein
MARTWRLGENTFRRPYNFKELRFRLRPQTGQNRLSLGRERERSTAVVPLSGGRHLLDDTNNFLLPLSRIPIINYSKIGNENIGNELGKRIWNSATLSALGLLQPTSWMLKTLHPTVEINGAPDFLAGSGEMASMMRTFDWATTDLGPPSSWPQSLKTAFVSF